MASRKATSASGAGVLANLGKNRLDSLCPIHTSAQYWLGPAPLSGLESPGRCLAGTRAALPACLLDAAGGCGEKSSSATRLNSGLYLYHRRPLPSLDTFFLLSLKVPPNSRVSLFHRRSPGPPQVPLDPPSFLSADFLSIAHHPQVCIALRSYYVASHGECLSVVG